MSEATAVGFVAEAKPKKRRSPAMRTTDSLRVTKEQAGQVSFSMDNTIERTAPDLKAIRQIYHNLDPARLLGSFIAAPIVDLLAGFVGKPKLQPSAEGMPEVAAFLEQVMEQNATAIMQAHRFALRDGKAYILFSHEKPQGPLYTAGEPGQIMARVVLADQMVVNRNALTGEMDYALLTEGITWLTEKGTQEAALLKTIYLSNSIERSIVGANAKPPEDLPLGVQPNKWGFIPVVEFVNEPETYGSDGISEIERVEPLMKLYHNTLEAAAKGSRLHSTPKLALQLADKVAFLKANFPEAIEAIKAGQKPKINLTGRELLILDAEDKLSYIEAANPVGAAIDLLKLIFYCMVITTETPEFALGVHMPSSYAATMEQTPIWSLKVARKQAQFTSSWHSAGRIMLAMNASITGKKLPSYAVQVSWPATDTRDKASVAKQQYDTVQAVLAAVDGLLMSDKAAIETLRAVFPAMAAYEGKDGETSEIEEIKRTAIERQALVNEQAPASAQRTDITATLATLLGQGGA